MSDELFPEPEVALPAMPLCEHVAEDYVTTGLSLKDHPVRFFRERLSALGAMRNAELRSEELRAGLRVTVAGLVLMRQMPGTAKGVVFMTLEDETDIANIIVWPKVFARNRRTVMSARFLAVRGRLQRAGLVIHVVAENFIDLSAELPCRDGCARAATCSHRNSPAARSRRTPRSHSRAGIFIDHSSSSSAFAEQLWKLVMPWILEAWKHRRDKRMSRSKWFALTIVTHPKVATERTSKGDGLGPCIFEARFARASR